MLSLATQKQIADTVERQDVRALANSGRWQDAEPDTERFKRYVDRRRSLTRPTGAEAMQVFDQKDTSAMRSGIRGGGLMLLFTLGLAIVPARATPSGLQTNPPRSTGAFARANVTPPRSIARAPVSAVVEVQQRNALIAAVTHASPSLATRNVVAMSRGQVVRLTDENIGNVLSTPTITAERVAQKPSIVALPASLSGELDGAKEIFVLPTQFTTLALGSDRPVSFHVSLTVLDSLHYDGSAGKFLARLAMTLLNAENLDDTSALTQELPVLIAANGADISPNEPKFTALHVPVQVHLAVAAPLDPYSVGALTALNVMPDSIMVPISLPEIMVLPLKDQIRGFGLEETLVTIRVAEARGRNGEVVVLQRTKGSIVPQRVTLDANGTGEVRLQSEGIGETVITASDPPFQDGKGKVQFYWPIAFALCTLAGGVVGAMLRRDFTRRKGRNILIGVLIAFVVTVGNLVGIKIGAWGTPAGPAGEGLIFFIAAMAAFLGRKTIEIFAKGGRTA